MLVGTDTPLQQAAEVPLGSNHCSGGAAHRGNSGDNCMGLAVEQEQVQEQEPRAHNYSCLREKGSQMKHLHWALAPHVRLGKTKHRKDGRITANTIATAH